METCENCKRQIGDLEIPQVYDEHVVCRECKLKLDGETAPSHARLPASGVKSLLHKAAPSVSKVTTNSRVAEHLPFTNKIAIPHELTEAKNYVIRCFNLVGTVDEKGTTDSVVTGHIRNQAHRVRVNVGLIPQPDGTTTAAIAANTVPINVSGRVTATRLAEKMANGRLTGFKTVHVFSARHAIILAACVFSLILFNLIAQFSNNGRSTSSSESDASSSASGPARSEMSFSDFAAKFGTLAQTTDLQKEEAFKGIKGSVVEWEGIVADVSANNVSIKEKATTSSFDVSLDIADNDQSSLASLNVGEKIKYSGVLESYGGAILTDHLNNGQILSASRVTEDDRVQWLANNETAIMEKIGH